MGGTKRSTRSADNLISSGSTKRAKNNQAVNKKGNLNIVTRKLAGQIPVTVKITPTSNMYTPLSDNSDEIIVTPNPPKVRIPPITIFDITRELILKAMDGLKITDFSLAPLRRGYQLHCKTIVDFKAVTADLTQSKCKYYTHELPSEKFYRVVLLGLTKMEPDKLESLLKEKSISPELIKTIVPKVPRYEGHTNYTLCFIKNTIKLETLREISELDKNRVRWEPYRRLHSGPTQCTRCMRPGHGSLSCNMPKRCEYCAKEDDHLSKDCPTYLDYTKEAQKAASTPSTAGGSPPKPFDIKMPSKCCNCQQEGHFATSDTCPRKRKYAETHSRKQRHPKQPPPRTAQQFVFRENDFPEQTPTVQRSPTFETPMNFAAATRRRATPAQPLQGNEEKFTKNINPFTMDEVIAFTGEIFEKLGDIQTASRSEVAQIIMQLTIKYLYDGGK